MSQAPNSILVADDDPHFRDVTCTVLREAGFVVRVAEDGLQATASIEAEPPDMVLLDIDMPNRDGWGVLEFLRATEAAPRVVLTTGLEDLTPPDHDLIQCVSGYLIKPCPIGHLLETCRIVLDGTHASPATGKRKDDRRLFVAEAVLVSNEGGQSTPGTLVNVSRRGFRLAITAGVQAGDLATVTLRVPGQEEPLRVTGRVRWRNESGLGAEIESISTTEEEFLQALLSKWHRE